MTALVPKFTRRRPAGGAEAAVEAAATAAASVVARLGQAKTGLMGGMWPTAQTLRTYTDVKAEMPKAVAEANAAFAKAAALATSVGKYGLKLTAPEPVNLPARATRK